MYIIHKIVVSNVVRLLLFFKDATTGISFLPGKAFTKLLVEIHNSFIQSFTMLFVFLIGIGIF